MVERSRLLMLVDEQPGDQEDRRSHPYVGPAGRVGKRRILLRADDRTAELRRSIVDDLRLANGWADT